jgi:hypothetical protein
MESGRGGMGSHKHGVSGHSRPNPVNLRQVARWLNARSDARAVLRERRRHDGMTGNIAAVFSPEPEPRRKKKRGRKQRRRTA